MASRFISPTFDAGPGIKPASGAKLFFFETGTSTAKDTFTTAAADIANANPVIADSNGVFPDIFISGTYKVILTDKSDIQVGFGEKDPVFETVNSDSVSKVFDTVADMQAEITSSGLALSTLGFHAAGDGGADDYIAYETTDIVPGYNETASTMLAADAAGVFAIFSVIAVRKYNAEIDVRQMGFKSTVVTFVSDRIGYTPAGGAFDNAATFQKYDALINFMDGHETTFSGSFAVGFTGFSTVRDSGNTCCRYSAKSGKLIGTVNPALIALPLADAIVIRTPLNADPGFVSKIDLLELEDFKVSGNWSQQTWAGPTGLEDPSDNPATGWVSGLQVYDQNGFSTINIKRLITNNSGASHCGQDGMPSGSVEYFHHTNLVCRWTGKGCNSNFNMIDGIYIDPLNEKPNESPDDTKVIYTLSGDGYAALGVQNIDEAIASKGTLNIVRPRGIQVNGRWGLFSVIAGLINPEVHIFDADVTVGIRNAITGSYVASGGGRIEIHGGDYYKEDDGRMMSLVNVPFVALRRKPYMHITNSNDGRIDVSGTTVTVEGSFRENGATANSILMTDVQDINLFDVSARAVGMITCTNARIRDSEITSALQTTGVTTFSFYNNSGADHPEKRPNELRASVTKTGLTVAANTSTGIIFNVPGAAPGDFVETVAATGSNSELFAMGPPVVTATDTVTVRLFNTTASGIALGSNIWSVIVRPRNEIQ